MFFLSIQYVDIHGVLTKTMAPIIVSIIIVIILVIIIIIIDSCSPVFIINIMHFKYMIQFQRKKSNYLICYKDVLMKCFHSDVNLHTKYVKLLAY